LCHHEFVLRYDTGLGVDGLPGAEGVFLACSFWLVDALHGTGYQREAHELFEKLLDLRNDVGLLREEYDPVTAGRSATHHRRSAWSASSTPPASSPEVTPPPRHRENNKTCPAQAARPSTEGVTGEHHRRDH
jgi:hypothetical protein